MFYRAKPGPLLGVTLPVGNDTEAVRASLCAIGVYLDQHLRDIIQDMVASPEELVRRVEQIHKDLEESASWILDRGAQRDTNRSHCHVKKPETKTYKKKKMGLQILHNVNKWVKSFIKEFRSRSHPENKYENTSIPKGGIRLPQQQRDKDPNE